MFVSLSVCLFVCLSVCLFVSLSRCLVVWSVTSVTVNHVSLLQKAQLPTQPKPLNQALIPAPSSLRSIA
jgi:hypothetical protein